MSESAPADRPQHEHADLVVVGAGAAGLMASIVAGRANLNRSIIALDGARSIGAKILVAGGGRCNVTHHAVGERAFAGSTPPAIRKVLRRFDVPDTIAFFRDLGVELKREETGKLFPVTDSAKTVLHALLGAARQAGVDLRFPRRVEQITREDSHFTTAGAWGAIRSPRVVIATGGKSLPKSGSDGFGYELVRRLGHTITPHVFPALVPLTLPKDHFICQLSGITLPTCLELRSGTGKRIISFTDSTLCTHFGLSGPSVLDISRYYLDAKARDDGAQLIINWLPDETIESLDAALVDLGRKSCARFLSERMPERLARALCTEAGVDPTAPGSQLTRAKRRALAGVVTEMPLPITGDRGFTHAEVTAGGVSLSEINLSTMESRICPDLFLCGEICDVDGRIGGFNFQWAWASGHVAGISALNVRASAD